VTLTIDDTDEHENRSDDVTDEEDLVATFANEGEEDAEEKSDDHL